MVCQRVESHAMSQCDWNIFSSKIHSRIESLSFANGYCKSILASFHHHFKICLLWLLHKKECSFYSCLFCCTLMRWLFIISSAIWDTGSVASRAQSELNRSKCEWTRIWTIYNVHETTPNLDKQYWQVVTMEPDFILWLLHINLFEVPNFIITLWLELDMWVVEHNHVPWNQYSS